MSKEFKVGLLVVISGAVLYLGFSFLKGKDFFSSTKSFHVQYDNIDGLTVSNPVILNGFTVGRVEGIEIAHEKGDSLIVLFNVNNDVAINNKTIAELVNSDLLGGKSIQLELNNGSQLLENGAFVLEKQEESLADILERAAVPVITNVDTLVESFKQYLRGTNEKNITSAIANLSQSMENLQKASLSMSKILGENQKNFNQVVTNLSLVSEKLNTTIDGLDPVMKNLGGFADSLNHLDLAKTISSANTTLESVSSLVQKAGGKDGSLGKLMNSDELHKNLEITLRDVDYLVTDIQANPDRYIHLNVIGGKSKDEKDLIKSIGPKSISNKVEIKLKREAPLLLIVKLYRADRTAVEVIPNGIGTKDISFNLPADFTTGEYIARLDWEVSSESFKFIVN